MATKNFSTPSTKQSIKPRGGADLDLRQLIDEAAYLREENDLLSQVIALMETHCKA
jgi:hypothetical protein